MFGIIISIILIIVGFIVPSFLFPDKKNRNGEIKSFKKIRNFITLICIILSILCIIFSCITIIHTGYTGILTTFGKVEENTLSAGINFHLPWQNVITMDNREQKIPFNLEAFSKDIQQVNVQGSINYNIDKTNAMNLYRDVGVDYATILINPRVLEDVKIIIAKYTAENLIENRQETADSIFELIHDELDLKGIHIISLAIENIDFTDAFESAVEAKQVATQEKQKAQTEQERITMEEEAKAKRAIIVANAEADQAKIAAQADLEVVKIQAEAALYAGEKEAEMNKRISEALSSELIQYYWIKQWNGQLPTVSTDSSMALINMNDVIDSEN